MQNQSQYNPWLGKAKPNYAGMRNDPRQLQQAQQQAGGMQGWANAAPFIGAGLGGVAGGILGSVIPGAGTLAGAGVGASLGGSLGGAVGAGMNNQAQQKMDPFREKSYREEAMWQALQGLR